MTAAGANVGATITAHHLLLNRNAIFVGGIRPHHYCLPVLKRETHREALVAAATSGSPKFFLGTDSAPHSRSAKGTACGCAGVLHGPCRDRTLRRGIRSRRALDRLEGFASFNGPDFYGLPRNVIRSRWYATRGLVPEALDYLADDPLVPLRAGEQIGWRSLRRVAMARWLSSRRCFRRCSPSLTLPARTQRRRT